MKNSMIRDGLYHSEGLSSTEHHVALALLYYRNQDTGQCTPAQSLIAKQTRLSLRAVKKAVAGLARAGVVELEHRHKGFTQYHFPEAVFLYVNRGHLVHLKASKNDLVPTSDPGCLPSIEAMKPAINESPIPDGMTRLQFQALKQFCEDVAQPASVQPWAFNLDAVDTHTTRHVQADPVDLGGVEWAKHNLRARELVGG